MKGCINEKKIPVVSFPTDKKFWKGYADYVRDNIKLKKLRGYLKNPPMKDFVLRNEEGFSIEIHARERSGLDIEIRKDGTELEVNSVFLLTDDGIFFHTCCMVGVPKCRRIREWLEKMVIRDFYLMMHTNESLPGVLCIDGGVHV